MAKFVQHEEFKKLNVGFALDEGKYRMTTPFYDEKFYFCSKLNLFIL
jgi:hypothetical protein